MADNSNILSDFGINLLEEDIDDVIFQTNEFLCDGKRIRDASIYTSKKYRSSFYS